MTQPRQPEDPPREPPAPDPTPGSPAQNGIPQGAEEANPKGRPSDDRSKTETAGRNG